MKSSRVLIVIPIRDYPFWILARASLGRNDTKGYRIGVALSMYVAVIPAQAGIQGAVLDSGSRRECARNDGK
jgi:hypothetical protein